MDTFNGQGLLALVALALAGAANLTAWRNARKVKAITARVAQLAAAIESGAPLAGLTPDAFGEIAGDKDDWSAAMRQDCARCGHAKIMHGGNFCSGRIPIDHACDCDGFTAAR